MKIHICQAQNYIILADYSITGETGRLGATRNEPKPLTMVIWANGQHGLRQTRPCAAIPARGGPDLSHLHYNTRFRASQ